MGISLCSPYLCGELSATMEQIVRESKRGAILTIHVVPRSARNEIAGIHGDALKVRLKAPPVEGAANAALIAFIAETLDVLPRQVKIISGHSSRHKVLSVSGLSREVVEAKLAKGLRSEGTVNE